MCWYKIHNKFHFKKQKIQQINNNKSIIQDVKNNTKKKSYSCLDQGNKSNNIKKKMNERNKTKLVTQKIKIYETNKQEIIILFFLLFNGNIIWMIEKLTGGIFGWGVCLLYKCL